ncbi:hypothetical protein D3C77_752030 [compost metagenome]
MYFMATSRLPRYLKVVPMLRRRSPATPEMLPAMGVDPVKTLEKLKGTSRSQPLKTPG